jgi:hypothetical protein
LVIASLPISSVIASEAIQNPNGIDNVDCFVALLLAMTTSHISHAQIARRANVPHLLHLASSGKSRRCFRASRLIEEGRIAIVTTRGVRGCGGRDDADRRTAIVADVKARGPDTPTLVSSS